MARPPAAATEPTAIKAMSQAASPSSCGAAARAAARGRRPSGTGSAPGVPERVRVREEGQVLADPRERERRSERCVPVRVARGFPKRCGRNRLYRKRDRRRAGDADRPGLRAEEQRDLTSADTATDFEWRIHADAKFAHRPGHLYVASLAQLASLRVLRRASSTWASWVGSPCAVNVLYVVVVAFSSRTEPPEAATRMGRKRPAAAGSSFAFADSTLWPGEKPAQRTAPVRRPGVDSLPGPGTTFLTGAGTVAGSPRPVQNQSLRRVHGHDFAVPVDTDPHHLVARDGRPVQVRDTAGGPQGSRPDLERRLAGVAIAGRDRGRRGAAARRGAGGARPGARRTS